LPFYLTAIITVIRDVGGGSSSIGDDVEVPEFSDSNQYCSVFLQSLSSRAQNARCNMSATPESLSTMKETYLQYPHLAGIEFGREESIPSAGSVFIQRRNKNSDTFILLLLSLNKQNRTLTSLVLRGRIFMTAWVKSHFP
jgi:hypothetical protein